MSEPSAGLRARAGQLKDLLRQSAELREMQRNNRPGEGFTGTVDTRRRLAETREQIRRQLRVQAGLPALSK